MTTDTPTKSPRLILMRTTTSLFAVVAVAAVSLDVLKGTQWKIGRAEWNQFVEAFGPKPTKPEPVTPTKREEGAVGINDIAALLSAIRLGGLLRPTISIGDLRLPNINFGPQPTAKSLIAPVWTNRTVTVFEKAGFGGGVVVTGHDYQAGTTASDRAYCYGEPLDGGDGLRHWLTLASRTGTGPITYRTITAEHAQRFKMSVSDLARLARTHCRFDLSGTTSTSTNEKSP